MTGTLAQGKTLAKQDGFGVAFTGTACSEPRLIELAYAYERATLMRVSRASVPR